MAVNMNEVVIKIVQGSAGHLHKPRDSMHVTLALYKLFLLTYWLYILFLHISCSVCLKKLENS